VAMAGGAVARQQAEAHLWRLFSRPRRHVPPACSRQAEITGARNVRYGRQDQSGALAKAIGDGSHRCP
jgi:hypothetical protein